MDRTVCFHYGISPLKPVQKTKCGTAVHVENLHLRLSFYLNQQTQGKLMKLDLALVSVLNKLNNGCLRSAMFY